MAPVTPVLVTFSYAILVQLFLVQAHIYDYYQPSPPNYYSHPQLYNPSPQNGFNLGGGQGFNLNLGNNFYQPSPPPPPIPNLLSTFQLPRQVRIPGRIEININGNTAEILCEFPRYLILIQKLHWHHRYDDPYGTYYDTNQNFAPRIHIQNEGKYKSILRIVGFSEDDFGHWRCLSSAVLPEDMEYFGNFPNPNPPPNHQFGNYFGRRKRSYYPNHSLGSSTAPPPPLKSLFAPFYRPSYGLFGVFQEIKFPAPQLQQIQQGGGGGSQLVRLGGSNNNTISTNNRV